MTLSRQYFGTDGVRGRVGEPPITPEIVCGVLVLLGWYTRPAAFVAAGEMAGAYFIGHAPQGNFLSPLLNQGESAVMFCFILLLLSVAGPGALGVDKERA